MRTRDFSFGANVLDEDDLPEQLRAVLEAWTSEFSKDSFAEDVSSKGVSACAVPHNAVVEREILLANAFAPSCRS